MSKLNHLIGFDELVDFDYEKYLELRKELRLEVLLKSKIHYISTPSGSAEWIKERLNK